MDGRYQRAVTLSGLLGSGIGSLALLQEVVERCVRSETHAEEKERVWVLAVVGRHRDTARENISAVDQL